MRIDITAEPGDDAGNIDADPATGTAPEPDEPGNHGVKHGEGVETGELRPQPHGGALRNGGTNKGGSGRPPSEIRSACREHGYTQIANLGKLADYLKSW